MSEWPSVTVSESGAAREAGRGAAAGAAVRRRPQPRHAVRGVLPRRERARRTRVLGLPHRPAGQAGQHTHTHTHTHTPLTHAHRALHFIAVRLLSSRSREGASLALAPPPCMCGGVYLTLPSLRRVNGPRPRVLLPGGAAVVQLQLSRAVCVELYAACRPMGRVVLREGGKTLAAGTITAVLA